VPAPANRRDDGLLATTLDTISVVGPLPARAVVHLDAGYDYQPCRQVLAERGMIGQIARRGIPAPIQGVSQEADTEGDDAHGTAGRGRRLVAWLYPLGGAGSGSKSRRCAEVQTAAAGGRRRRSGGDMARQGSRAQGSERVRTAELIAALCLATDLGMAFPFEHGLHTTLIAMRLANKLGIDQQSASQTYYGCLLCHASCTTEAHVAAEIFGGSLTTNINPVRYGSAREILTGMLRALPDPGSPAPLRAVQTARRLPRAARQLRPALSAGCEVAGRLAEQVGAPPSVPGLLAHLTERWDGKGPLRRAKGEQIPLPMRIVHVATDAALQWRVGGVEHAVRLIGERAGHAFDPQVAACVVEGGGEILALDDSASAWEEVLALEPPPPLVLEPAAIDRALGAMGNFADLVSPSLAGHSGGVAELAAAAARYCGIEAVGVAAIRRAGLVHDLGRVAAHPRIWQKPGPLSADEWEQVRLHPYQTERVLSRSGFLAALAPIAGGHHERLDGSGYHRGCVGAALTMPARVLAAADAYHAMTEPRPRRQALTPQQAATTLGQAARLGRLDPGAVAAVCEAAGQRVPRLARPAGLTEREAEVIGLLARGLQTKQVARALGISIKTADRHIQNAYGKLGVSTRAAAALVAMEHGLVTWGELPMGRPKARS
jgi:HD-GYP domain-containing protein (c-di-GMP phosphodiesterase class II)